MRISIECSRSVWHGQAAVRTLTPFPVHSGSQQNRRPPASDRLPAVAPFMRLIRCCCRCRVARTRIAGVTSEELACRFAGSDVVASINYRGNGYVCRWQALRGGLFRQAALSRAVPAAITGLDVSPSGSLLGLANAEGHSLLLQSSSLAVSLRNKKAHMVFGTDVAFAPHSGAFLSVSGDASARVNLVPAPQSAMAPLVRLLVLLCLALVALVVLDHMGMLQGELGRRLSPVAQSVRSVADTAAEGLSLRIRSVLHSRSITM